MKLMKHMQEHMSGLFRLVWGFVLLVLLIFVAYVTVRLVERLKEWVDTRWFFRRW